MLRMRDMIEDDRVRAGITDVLRESGEAELADAYAEADRRTDLIAALGDRLEEVATALERIAVDPASPSSVALVMDFATALRLCGPPEARRGAPLEWQKGTPAGWWRAIDSKGTSWDVGPGSWATV